MVSRNRIRKIEVQGVIDRYDYNIDFMKGDPGIKAIYAENGHGKTNMLRVLRALVSNNLEEFKQILHLPYRFINIETNEGWVQCERESLKQCSIKVIKRSGGMEECANISASEENYAISSEIKLDDINHELEDIERIPGEVSDFMREYRDVSMEIYRVVGNIVFLDSNRLQNKHFLNAVSNRRHWRLEFQGRRKKLETTSYNQDISGEVVDGALQMLALSLRNEARRVSLGESHPNRRYVYYNIVKKIVKNENDANSLEYKNPEEAIRSKVSKIKEGIKKIDSYGFINSQEFNRISDTIEEIPEGNVSAFKNLRSVLIPYLDNISSQIETFSVIVNLVDVFSDAMNTMLNGVELRFNEENYGEFSIHSKYGNQGVRLEADLLSSGEKHLIVLMSVLTICSLNSTSLLLIDEPEISLGVSWQLTLGKYIRRLAGGQGTQIVFATHSPVILDGYNKENIIFDHVKRDI